MHKTCCKYNLFINMNKIVLTTSNRWQISQIYKQFIYNTRLFGQYYIIYFKRHNYLKHFKYLEYIEQIYIQDWNISTTDRN